MTASFTTAPVVASMTISQDDLKALAVLSQRNHIDKGLKYTFDKRVYDCGERAADNHTYCKVKGAATIDERLEFLPKFEFVFLFHKVCSIT